MGPAHRLFQQSLEAIWLDGGWQNAEQLRQYSTPGRVVASLESIASPAELDAMCQQCPGLIFSLDLRNQQPMRSWPGLDDPRDIAARAVQAGAGTILVLDLGDVGMNRGVSTLSLCRDLVRRHPQVAICAGGGVRSQEDLLELADAGLHAAVVASALHDGRIRSLKGYV